MFEIQYLDNNKFRVICPDGTRTYPTNYDLVLFFTFNKEDYIACTSFYGRAQVAKCTPCESIEIDLSNQ